MDDDKQIEFSWQQYLYYNTILSFNSFKYTKLKFQIQRFDDCSSESAATILMYINYFFSFFYFKTRFVVSLIPDMQNDQIMETSDNKTGDVQYRIKLVQGDITKLNVDAIVNAANRTLLGGGGVDGAIHRAAGPELLEYCHTLNGCNTGEAKLSPGFRLPAKYVIHAVGPVWRNGTKNETALLASAYRNSLEIAKENKFTTVAFPNISTGIYGFPKDKAAEIAIKTVTDFLSENDFPKEVWFAIFDDSNMYMYRKLLNRL